MSRDEFLSAASEQFGSKVVVQTLSVSEQDAEKLGLTAEAIGEYPPQAWIPEIGEAYGCPVCDHALGGFLGSFRWGLIHGEGECSACNKALFRYYHYIMRGRPEATLGSSKRYPPLKLFALVGF